MVLGLVQAAHENTLHNKSVSLRLLHDLLPNFSRSQEVRSAPASTQSMVHRMRTVEHASPLHTVGAEESSVQVRRPNNFVEPSNEPRTACTSASDSLSISAACVLGGSPRFFSLRDLSPGAHITAQLPVHRSAHVWGACWPPERAGPACGTSSRLYLS
ncbi:unnamed protein product [Prorocentrum cordatum]|uniref:Anaphase-promoting complex subunit 1 n=2 Tax=Prorocentrum cordatum TaxID=2364126 RepID=A0ABN9XXR8_9DINO|nr:unnamed protein product [Polarella glacialis]